jgi:hypothetical protein
MTWWVIKHGYNFLYDILIFGEVFSVFLIIIHYILCNGMDCQLILAIEEKFVKYIGLN